MTEVLETLNYAPGTFCMAELGCTDIEAAKAFYCDLFGWGTRDLPGFPGYVVFTKGGRVVCGAWPASPELLASGFWPGWESSVSVADVDAAARRAVELGGRIWEGPKDTEYSRFAVVADPTRATLVLFRITHEDRLCAALEATQDTRLARLLTDEVGSMCWNELLTLAPAKAAAFYRGLFGWEVQKAPGDEYTFFVNREHTRPSRHSGAMSQLTPEIEAIKTVPGSCWFTYFRVADCAAACARAESLGGKVVVAPEQIQPGIWAVLQDPQGAQFGIIEYRGS